MAREKEKDLTLFGGDKGWQPTDWTASDDRVRGGKSQSYLDTSEKHAVFHGNLDIKTLGGAGFASQRTTGESRTWDLSAYSGILLHVGKADGKRYTFILKDEILPKNPDNGREQSTISYEYDFTITGTKSENDDVFVKWNDLVPTYRGKEKKDAKKLDTSNVKRISIMMRSFFGDQEGDFSLVIKSIKAVSYSEDLEEGLGGTRGSGRRHLSDIHKRIFSRKTLLGALGICIVTYGIWLFVCPRTVEKQLQWPWRR